jgi:hypothetical protein
LKKNKQLPVVRKTYSKKSSNGFLGIPTNTLLTGGTVISLAVSAVLIWKVFFSNSNGKKQEEEQSQNQQQNSQSLTTTTQHHQNPQPVMISKNNKFVQDQNPDNIRNNIRSGRVGSYKLPQQNMTSQIQNNIRNLNNGGKMGNILSNTPPTVSVGGQEGMPNDRTSTIPNYDGDYYSQVKQATAHLPPINYQLENEPTPTPRI